MMTSYSGIRFPFRFVWASTTGPHSEAAPWGGRKKHWDTRRTRHDDDCDSGSVLPRQHDSEAVELIADSPECNFRERKIRAGQSFNFQNLIVAIVRCEQRGSIRIDGEFPHLEIFAGDRRRSMQSNLIQ